MKYVKPERVVLKGHPDLTERWVQDRIAEDPSVLGLGDLILKDKERIHPEAGRLDLLFQDQDSVVGTRLNYSLAGPMNRTSSERLSTGTSKENGTLNTIT